MAKLKKGGKMVCVPCGREVAVTASGISRTTIWCCGRPMAAAKKAVKAKRKQKKK